MEPETAADGDGADGHPLYRISLEELCEGNVRSLKRWACSVPAREIDESYCAVLDQLATEASLFRSDTSSDGAAGGGGGTTFFSRFLSRAAHVGSSTATPPPEADSAPQNRRRTSMRDFAASSTAARPLPPISDPSLSSEESPPQQEHSHSPTSPSMAAASALSASTKGTGPRRTLSRINSKISPPLRITASATALLEHGYPDVRLSTHVLDITPECSGMTAPAGPGSSSGGTTGYSSARSSPGPGGGGDSRRGSGSSGGSGAAGVSDAVISARRPSRVLLGGVGLPKERERLVVPPPGSSSYGALAEAGGAGVAGLPVIGRRSVLHGRLAGVAEAVASGSAALDADGEPDGEAAAAAGGEYEPDPPLTPCAINVPHRIVFAVTNFGAKTANLTVRPLQALVEAEAVAAEGGGEGVAVAVAGDPGPPTCFIAVVPTSLSLKKGATGHVEASVTLLRPGASVCALLLVEVARGLRLVSVVRARAERRVFGVPLPLLMLPPPLPAGAPAASSAAGVIIPAPLVELRLRLTRPQQQPDAAASCIGLDVEGIFRVQPGADEVAAARAALDAGTFRGADAGCSALAAAHLVKVFLRELQPAKLLAPIPLEPLLAVGSSAEECAAVVARFVPAPLRALLAWLVDLLAEAASHEPRSRMGPKALAVCVGPNLLDTDAAALAANPMNALMASQKAAALLARLVEARVAVRASEAAATAAAAAVVGEEEELEDLEEVAGAGSHTRGRRVNLVGPVAIGAAALGDGPLPAETAEPCESGRSMSGSASDRSVRASAAAVIPKPAGSRPLPARPPPSSPE